MAPLALHPDRALPAEPGVRAIARRLYAATAGLPLVCLHGHVDAAELAADVPFTDPAQLLVVPDHYVTRMLVSQGVRPDQLVAPGLDPREIWRLFCASWPLFRGTPSRYWLEHELVELFGIDERPGADNADRLYDRIAEVLARPEFRRLALLDRFGIEVLATTDPATCDLTAHEKLAAAGYRGRIIPTFRPDAVVYPDRPGWRADVDLLGRLAGVDVSNYHGYLDAVRRRRRAFADAGALATDHGHDTADTTPLPDDEAERIYAAGRTGSATPAQAQAFAAHLLFQMARMSCEDGLVLQLHPGVLRNHHDGIAAAYGPDRGFDIPVAAEFTRALRPLLQAFGHEPGFRMVLFTVDETVYARELAPLAGAYPSIRLGAPWWFLDSPDGMRRFREAATETAGFANTSGFVDDTRAFASIPARHDLARRIDAGYLARLVAEHRLGEDEAHETAIDLAYRLPKAAYQR
ncbi:glucuronate isomerase [Cryptosporangium aurantiacum]|uniref:Uronate isomerase n=1 Tax=Cryptosporangium aurantiacum TaxID=134849 RepID=A0A1M7RPA9_9ACTN|nr:glucuronate isomerase [Cryptosporangium aurantiacum]SHN48094.1 glucuronate isomerase [Cryptosporangium aurantiacum]